MKKKIVCTDGKIIYRVSRWIKRKTNYNVNKRNSLYYYATDENGYKEGQEKFNPKNGLYLDFFRWNGRNYAIEQFFRLGSMFCPLEYSWEDKEGKLNFLSGYDSENYYNPILIELDDSGEYVRVYEEGK